MAQLASTAGASAELPDEDTLDAAQRRPGAPTRGRSRVHRPPAHRLLRRAQRHAAGLPGPCQAGGGTVPARHGLQYWFVLCFKIREDKDCFLAKTKLLVIGDKYLDGYDAARVLGVGMDD